MPRMPVLIIHQLSMRNVPIKVMLSMDISLSVIYTKAKFACKQKNLYWSKVDSDFDIKMIENKSMVLHFQTQFILDFSLLCLCCYRTTFVHCAVHLIYIFLQTYLCHGQLICQVNKQLSLNSHFPEINY